MNPQDQLRQFCQLHFSPAPVSHLGDYVGFFVLGAASVALLLLLIYAVWVKVMGNDPKPWSA
jgi:hypothetical protein